MKQPKYWELEIKAKARLKNVEVYNKLTGREVIPEGREYWTLCNEQPLSDGSEIVQLVKLGFLKKEQFFGVDRDAEIIEKNKGWHPEANWHCGEWTDVIREQNFKPAFVYLDLTNFADRSNAINIVQSTMLLCPLDTVLFVNAMLNDPRSSTKINRATLIDKISKRVGKPELKKWAADIQNFSYTATGRTRMITYALHKKG